MSSFKKIYWIKNFETDENITFPEDKISLDKLKEYNDKGFNIYQSVNTFIWNRRLEKDLAEIKSCFIDIDFPDIISLNLDSKQRAIYLKDKYEKDILPKLKEIKIKYNIEPNEINVTYKGFHILFHYDSSCFFINPEQHKEINNKLNEILGWDENARDVARVYKIPWFIDWKYWNQGKIKSIINNNTHFITKDILENKFNIYFKETKQDKITTKSEIKTKKQDLVKKNIEKINNINAFDFIEKLKNIFEKEKNNLKFQNNKFKKLTEEILDKILNKLKFIKKTEYIFSLLEEDGVSETSWLRIEKSSIWFEINDYSKKTRRGNYNFLKNWILDGIELPADNFIKLLYDSTWFTLSTSLEKRTEIDSKILWDRMNNNIFIDLNDLNDFNKELFLDYSSKKIQQMDKKSKFILFSVLSLIRGEKAEKIEKENEIFYKIYWEDLFNFLEDSKDKSFRRKTKKEYLKILLYCSDISFPFNKVLENSSWKKENIILYKKIFNVWNNNEKVHKGKKDFFIIEPLMNKDFIFSNSVWYYNKNILSSKLKDTVKDFSLFIDWLFKNTDKTIAIFSFEDLFKRFELNSSEQANLQICKKHLNNLNKLDFIKKFEIDSKTKLFKIYKFK